MPSRYTLIELPGRFAVCRLAPDAPIPEWSTKSDFFSITRTSDELSIVCQQDSVPEGVQCERDWRCLRIAGTIPFATTGVLAGLTAPLAATGIGIFAISTFDTDYLFVKQEDWPTAVDALRCRGYAFG